MATSTAAWQIPIPTRPDPFALTADLAKSFAKVDSMGSQATALSNAAVTSSEAAQIAAAQALARALAIEEPVHVGPTPPTDGESIWVDTSEDAPPIPTDVPWEDVTGKPTVFPPEAHTHTWGQVNDKPTTYPPSAHSHVVTDVTGLVDRLARLEFDSGWRDVSSLLPAGLVKSSSNGRCNIKRKGDRLLVDMNLTVSVAGITTVMAFPAQWRPDVAILNPFTYWTSTSANSGRPVTVDSGYIGSGGGSLRTSPLPNPGTVMISLDLPISSGLPTNPVGEPA